MKAQRLGRYKKAKNLVSKYSDHPLYGYILYHDLKRRLSRAKPSEINSFLKIEGNSRVGQRLRKLWLIRLYKSRNWKDFIANYHALESSEIETNCRFYEAKIKSGEGAEIIKELKETWLSGMSLPKECDPAFTYLYSTNSLSDEFVWARIKKAYNKNNPALASYLSRYLKDKELIKLQGYWSSARRSPNRFLKRQKLSDTTESRDILVLGLNKLSKSNFESAITIWGEISKNMRFSQEQRSSILTSLGAAGARRQDKRALKFLDSIGEKFVTQKTERNRLTLGIYLKAWPELVKWTRKPPRSDISISRWQYWRAFALREVGRASESEALFKEVAKRRDYHGFLAADILGTEYQLSHKEVSVTKEAMNRILKASNFSRANELFTIGKKLEAKREFFHELGRSSDSQLEIAAKIAQIWDWPKGSIFALGRASSYDDLHLRFPIRYTSQIKEELTPKSKYTVQKGDSLWRISAKFGVTINKLRRWNNLKKKSILLPGQRLIVKDSVPSRNTHVKDSYYKIRTGDSLWKISRKFNIPLKNLKDWNNMNSRSILKIGKKIKVGNKKHRRYDLSLARTLAIIRAESAFDPYARSPANARGLMQIIPPTARFTARKHGVRLNRIKDLYKPKINIMIGTAYLSDLLNDFRGNFAMAAAAYNAGPHRARRWQRQRCGDPRMWIDSIPITETRRYVRRAIFYARIYEWRLGIPVQRIEKKIGIIPKHKKNPKTKECWL